MGKSFTEFPAVSSLVAADVALVSKLSATVTITAATLSALASDNSFNDSGSGFVTAGFVAGDKVNVSGFTGNAANNIFQCVITALTAGKMTIGGTDGDVIVDDAAGESVTISKWETHRCVISDINAVLLSTKNQSFTGGLRVTSYPIGTVSSGTTTIDTGNGPQQYMTNGGASTIAAPSNDGSCTLLITNNGSAGAITWSGFTVGSSTGDALDTTNGHKFLVMINRTNSVSTYIVKALQ